MFSKTRFQNAEKASTLSDVEASSRIVWAGRRGNRETPLPDFQPQVKSKNPKRNRTLLAFLLSGRPQ
jgi:hypothetical protein